MRPFAAGDDEQQRLISRGSFDESSTAGQLHHWNLPHEGHDGTDGKRARATILEAISPRIQSPGSLRTLCQDSADALDAVLCLFSAKAAADGLAVVDDPVWCEKAAEARSVLVESPK